MGNGCSLIDSGRQPDENNPFNNNTKLFDNIKASKCTQYQRDPVTGQIDPDSWSNPLPITDTIENLNAGVKSVNNSGIVIPQNICFENAQFFGSNPNQSYQNSFTQNFCNNITPPDDVDYFSFPQDFSLDGLNFRVFVFGLNPSTGEANKNPEWGTPQQSVFNQAIYNIRRNELIAAGIFITEYTGAFEAAATGGGIVGAAASGALSRATVAIGEAFSNGTGTAAAPEEIELQDFAALEDAAEEADVEVADLFIETGSEAIAASIGGAAVGGAAATAGTEAASGALTAAAGSGPAFIISSLALIAAGFAQDLADSTCGYDDMHPPTLVYQEKKGHPKVGCCRDSCAIPGALTSCARNGGNGFNASFFQCCFQDFDCHSNKTNNSNNTVSSNNIGDNKFDLCFQTQSNNKIATCHPDARSLNSNICSSVIGAYCTGLTPFGKNQDSLLDAWSANGVIDFENENGISFSVKAPCLNFLARLLTGGTTLGTNICSWQDFINAELSLSPELLNPVGLTIAQDMLENILNQYIETHGTPIGKIDANGYLQSSDFLTWFFNLCKDYPFLCQNSLSSFCSGLTANDLLTKPETIQWCGCYLSDENYSSYDKFSIPKQCTPICNRANNIPLIGDDGVPILCTDTVCMIDDLAIKLAETFTEGPIEFNQVCNTCGGSKITKQYTSSYQSNQNTNITQFFELSPLSLDEYNLSYVVDYNNRETELVGYDVLTSTETYPISSNTNYIIIKADDTSLSFTVQFNLGVPLIIPGSNNIAYYIASFTDDTVKNLTNNENFINNLSSINFAENIFYITLEDGKTSPLPNKKLIYLRVNYYKAGETKVNGNDTITQSYIQSIVTDVSQYNVGEINKNCSCVVNGNINFVNEQVNNLQFNNNCGNTTCYDNNGNRIACSNGNVNVSNSTNITNQTIAKISDNVAGFNSLTENQKTEFITTSTVALFVVIVIANFFLIKYPKKYKIILIAFLFLFIMTIIIMYIIYSNSFGISNLNNIF